MSDAQLQRLASGRYRLRGVLDFDSVPGLSARGPELFDEAETVEVDLAEVARADSAGVALLVEWMQQARRRGGEIRYLNIPSQMLAIARVSGLDHILPLSRGS